jgi:hypothetical protein
MLRNLVAAVVLSAFSPALGVGAETGLPLSFVENLGQWDTPARFVARRGPMVARFEKDAIVLQLETRDADGHVTGVVVRLAFEGAASGVALQGGEQQPGRYNYLLGSDRSKWRTNVPAYSEVLYRGLYEGVDLRVRDQAGRLEYDLLLAPGADLTDVTISADGIEGIEIEPDGVLVMQTALGPIAQRPPTSWYELPTGEQLRVESHFCEVGEKSFGFEVPQLDSGLALVIDPGLEWSTFLGGSGDDQVLGFAVDESGIATVAGNTDSLDFPTTIGAYDPGHNGFRDAFVSRLNPDLTGEDQLVWSTYLGGSGIDEAFDVVLQESGAATVVGLTSSTDFPTTPDAYDTTYNGALDAFCARLRDDGAGLLWSTYLGAGPSASDWANAVAVDASGVVTVAGYTGSPAFPTTPGAFDEVYNGGIRDAFVSRLDPSQSGLDQLVWSTFLGSTGQEGFAYDPGFSDETGKLDMDLQDSGVVTVGGFTTSADFPTTAGAYDTTYNGGGADAFVSRLDPSLEGVAQLVWSTFLGGATEDETVRFLVVDDSGVVTITGHTRSSDMPTTKGAYDTTHNSPGGVDNDGFVSRLDPSLDGPSQLVYSTFLGGSDGDAAASLAVDAAGKITTAYFTLSPDFPTTAGAYDTTLDGIYDGFVSRLDPSLDGLNQLTYSTFLGNTGGDWVYGVALDGPDDVVLAGGTDAADFPVTDDAYDTTYNGGSVFLLDVWVARLDLCPHDLDDSGSVGTADLLDLLSQWGTDPGGPPDFDGGGNVGTADLLELLSNWGPCP